MTDGHLTLTIALERSAGHLVVAVAGDLDAASAPDLLRAVEARRPLEGSLVIDVAGLTFVDSAGLRALIALRRRALDDTGQPARLRSVDTHVRRVLELSGLESVFEIDNGNVSS